MIPTLTTDRLRLRGWELEDFPSFCALKTNAELQAFVGGAVSEIAAWEDFCAKSGQWMVRGVGIFLVAERESNKAVGFSGLWFPHDLDEPELCWSLFPGNEGKGFATEAAIEARRWANVEQCLGPLVSFVHPENHASRAIAERLGAKRVDDGSAVLRGHPRHVYRHPLVAG